MNETQRTPGAWQSSHTAGFNGPALFAEIDGKNVRLANFVEATEADRVLIATAPDLLESLNGLFQHCAMIHKHWGEGCNQKEASAAIANAQAAIANAQAAIAKAEGRE